MPDTSTASPSRAGTPRRPDGIEFGRGIERVTRDFTGREWVFRKIDDWLANDTPRVFLLTGGPGTGKSAISAQIVRISQGEVSANEYTALKPGAVGAIHFCQARRDETLDPLGFVRALALSLSRHEAFAEALLQIGDQDIVVTSKTKVGHVESGAQVHGIHIESLHIGAISARVAFTRIILQPLRALCKTLPEETNVLVLVDGLDEAVTYAEGESIVSLLGDITASEYGLPRQVRFLLTSRPEPRVLAELPPPSLDLERDLPNDNTDLHSFIESSFMDLDEALRTSLADQIVAAGEGNFLYARYVVDDLRANPVRLANPVISDLPEGLDDVYRRFLRREIARNATAWDEQYRPLLGALAVAHGEGFTRDQLAAITEREPSQTAKVLRACMQYLDGPEDGPYRIYHQSFRDFLLQNDDYEVFPEEVNRQIAVCIRSNYGRRWESPDSLGLRDYGLRHLVTHIAEGVRGALPKTRHTLATHAVDLTLDPAFQTAHHARIDDPAALRRDLATALGIAASDDDPEAIVLVVRSAFGLLRFVREQSQPQVMFDLARRGDVDGAERRLALFSVEEEWHLAALLSIAWLAAGENADAATRLRNRIAPRMPSDGPLALLLRRLDATLNGTTIASDSLPPLPPTPPEELINVLRRRVGGIGVDTEMLYKYEMMQTREEHDPQTGMHLQFMSEWDGPQLVAYAVENEATGFAHLIEYVDIHTEYGYTHYRNRSLSYLLDAVTRHPSQAWVCEAVPRLVSSALAISAVDFQEALPLTVLALRARDGTTDALEQLETRDRQIRDEADPLHLEPRDGDPWGLLKRWLSALAEAYALVLDRPDEATEMHRRALELPYSFAGFQALSNVTLADSIHVCRPDDTPSVQQALDAALSGAHHIQDAVHCARTTARVMAMRMRWNVAAIQSLDLDAAIERLTRDAATPEFAPIHIIGESFNLRSAPSSSQPLPPEVTGARSLAELRNIYQRPLSEFNRLNKDRGWGNRDEIAIEKQVAVPDTGFAPLLAARLSAEVLTRPELASRKGMLIQSLVPVAAADPTSLDVVLARLLIASPSIDPGHLIEIGTMADAIRSRATGGAAYSAIIPS